MIVLGILSKKRYITKENGDLCLDLTRGSINPIQFAKINPIAIHVVTDDDKMRPDLISHRLYGNHHNVDILLKYNAISNPFSIDAGDVLKIPSDGDISKIVSQPEVIKDIGLIDESNTSKNLLNPKTTKDNKRLEELAKTREILPSNINKKTDKNVKVKDGKLVFGEDVTAVNKDNCPEPISRARLKKSLIKNNLFG